MINLSKDIQDKYPKDHEIEAILREARIMRARVLRDGAARFWAMVHRGVTRGATASTPAEA